MIGHYPLHHGGLAAIQSLSHAGVSVMAVTEDRFTPVALSRHLSGRIVWPTTGSEEPGRLLDRLLTIGASLPTKPMLLCTDEEGAVLAAEGRALLQDVFVMPDVPLDLPRSLASKRGLSELCLRHGVASPATFFPVSKEELHACARQLGFPVVLKNVDPFTRLVRPHVRRTTCVADEDELREVARHWKEPYGVLVQEYMPREHCVDWLVNGYIGREPSQTVVFTGRKLVASPPFGHTTALGMVVRNEQLAAIASKFCAAIDYRDIFFADWRQDVKNGTFHLVDFNPRVGATFSVRTTKGWTSCAPCISTALGARYHTARLVRASAMSWRT
jgi:predicted ATP-grasp superfamily ATP-dependent carboligase